MPDKTVTLTFEQWEDLIDLIRRERSAAIAAGDTSDAESWAEVLDALGERGDDEDIP